MANKIIMTDGSRTETIYRVKGLNPFTDETPGVWTPDPTDQAKQAKSTRLVPSIFAGISARMQAMMDLPFTIYGKGDAAVDDSDDYQNILGFLPNPQRVFGLSEAALITNGKAYWYKGTGVRTGAVKELKYWMPTSINLNRDALKRSEILFERVGTSNKFPAEQVLYFWGYDEGVELGPPTVYPLASAMTAAEANGAITAWIRDYMQRGAIKAMLLAVDGAPPEGEVARMETWWNRFMSGARGMAWKVFNMANVKPTIVGDGLEALKDLGISKELRYDIHQALGTRHLLEDENLATANARERQFYTTTVVPDARLIQQGMNEQILHALGYHLEFEPERLEIFQENEGEQAQAFGELFDIFSKVMTSEAAFQLASEKLDYQFTDEQMALIEKGIAEKKKEAEKLAAEMAKQPEAEDEQPVPKKPMPKALIELDKWEKKVLKAGKMVTWHAVHIADDIVKAVSQNEMTFAQAREQLQDKPAPNDDALILVMEGLRKAIDAL